MVLLDYVSIYNISLLLIFIFLLLEC